MPELDKQNDVSAGRRRLIKILLGGGAIGSAALLPERWVRPAIDAVILPAHAATSKPLE